MGTLFYIIEAGSVEFSNNEGVHLFKNSGECFGKSALVENGLRYESATASEYTTLLCLSGELYRNALEYMYLKSINDKINILKSIPIFSK
jgi:hypothetical protein